MYDDQQKLYIFPVDVIFAGTTETVDFDFGTEIGPLGTASLSGQMNFTPELRFAFELGLDLNPADIPRIYSSQNIPAPSNGQITSNLTFNLYLNNSAAPITVTLAKSATTTNTTLAHLADDLNAALTAAANYTPPGGVSTDLRHFVRFDAANTILVLSAVNEDYDFDGKRDTANEDANGNGYLDGAEDVDGDGHRDVAEPDWDFDGVLDNRTGEILQIRITVDINDVFATELGFGSTIEDPNLAYPLGWYESIANAPMKGFFLDHVALEASLAITTPGEITGSLVFGFLELVVAGGKVETQDPDRNLAAMTASVGIRAPTTGSERFYMPELMDVLSDIGTYIDFSLEGGVYAGLDDITAEVGGSTVLSSGEISVWIPNINDLTLNENTYDIGDASTDNDSGIFLTYPNVGLGGGFSFEELSFFDIINGIEAVVDQLSEFSAFSFLDEKIPLIDLSIHDMVDYVGKFAELVEEVANGDAGSIQAVLEELEAAVESLFHISPDSFDISYDTNGINYSNLPGSDVITHSGDSDDPATVTFDPNGLHNGFTLTRDVDGDTWNGTTLRIKGSNSISGNAATVSWDEDKELITILINPGVTTATTIINAINSTIGANWTAANSPGSNGSGTPRTNAIKFSWDWTTAYAEEVPLHLDIVELLAGLGGDNPGVQAFLSFAQEILHIEGNGLLNVSASAEVTLAFGLDLTNMATPTPFLYDDTGVELLAKVTVSDLEFDAAIGALGVFVRGGEVIFDYDGGGESTDSAVIALAFKNLDGDNRHYFDSSLLSLDSIGITAHAGIYASLPLFAPVESLPIGGSTEDGDNDGFADNALGVDIPDLVRLLLGDSTARFNSTLAERADMIFAGPNNDIRLQTSAGSGLSNVKIKFSDNGLVPASYSGGPSGGTITFNIDSGVTTAQQLLTYIGNPLNFPGRPAGLTFSLAASDSGNDGSGTLSKVRVAAPDLTDLFGDLDLCDIIDSAVGPLLDGLDATLGDIQAGLEEVVLNTDLPLLGDGLAGAASFISDFRNGLLADLREAIAAAGGSAVQALEDAIKSGIWSALGPDGLNLLVDFESGSDFDADATFDDLDVTLSCDDGLVVNLRVKKFLALLDTSENPIDFDIGVPGFGLEVDGNVTIGIGFDLRLVFGFNKEDGFYLGTEGGMEDPELVLSFEATIPGLHAAGELFFLRLDVSDDADAPSYFSGGFYVDLMDPSGDGKLTFAELSSSSFEDIVHGELAAEAHLSLDIAASFGGNTAFPRLLADFSLDWSWSLSEGATEPEIEFGNIRLDLGEFISNVLGPILEEVKKITEPIQPIIDIVTFALPVLSQLAGQDITLLDMAAAFGYLDPDTVRFIEQVLDVVELINLLPTGTGSIQIPIGAFSMIAGEDGEMETNPLGNLGEIDLEAALDSLGDDSDAGSTQVSQTAGFAGKANSMENLIFPWLKDPTKLFALFTGGAVQLVEWRFPTFAFEFTYTQKIPIFGPLSAQFGGTIGAYFELGFGFSTHGIQRFIEGGATDPLLIFDGFNILDWDINGNERPEITLKGELFAGISISIGPVEVGINAGFGFEIFFDLNDVTEDGMVHISELLAQAAIDPRCIFDINGRVYLFLEAYLIVDLFFFKIDETFRFGEFTLFEFESTCPEPVLASVAGGVLTIHVGDAAGDREEIDTNDGSETFVIKHLEGADGTETVEVQWGQYRQSFGPASPDHPDGFTSIAANLGAGNDHIDFTGVLSAVTVYGGTGNDVIILGLGPGSKAYGDEGDDTITAGEEDGVAVTSVVIEGGDGADLLTGGNDGITIRGDGGSDTIYGTPGIDFLYGGDGTDIIYAYGASDQIWGDAGNDTIYADTGDDEVWAGAGNDVVEAGVGNDRVDAGDGSDIVYGSDGNDLLMGGNGDDQLNGHGGVDLLVGDVFNMAGFSAANMTSLAAAATGGTFSVLGITGSGNDMLIGGGNFDVMFGGDGDDFIFGGNLFLGGESQVIEDDNNDFMDGGRGNDQMFGDDSNGNDTPRLTGIGVEGVVFHDLNLNNYYDDGDRPLPGVTVKLYKGSDDSLIGSEVTDSAGRWQFLGLDPNDYYLRYFAPAGYFLAALDTPSTPNSTLDLDHADESSVDNDALNQMDPIDGLFYDQTDAFQLDYEEEETSVTAGYQGFPALTIANEAVRERAAGQTNDAVFTLTLSGPSGLPITIYYRLDDGTDDTPGYGSALKADGDYEDIILGAVTFQPGETTKSITVTVNGDDTFERHEGFILVLTPLDPTQLSGAPATIESRQTIINDDAAPSISITDAIITEPTAGNVTAIFTVRLTNLHWDGVVTVMYQTTDATLIDGSPASTSASAGSDYTALVPNTLTFGPGEFEKFIMVTVKQDSIDEYDEAFYVNLFNPAYATIADDRGYGIIKDTDDAPTVMIRPVSPDADPSGQSTTVPEGNTTSQEVFFNVTVTGQTSRTITVRWDVARGTANPDSQQDSLIVFGDYVNPSAGESLDNAEDSDTMLVFTPNGLPSQLKTVSVTVNGDVFDEDAEEHFFVNLVSADGATITRNHVTVRITDDDAGSTVGGPYDVRFARSQFQEYEGDVVKDGFLTLVRTPGPTQAFAVLTITGGSATNSPGVPHDYSAPVSQLIVFAANEYVLLVPISINGDLINESNETITFSLRRPTGAPGEAPHTATMTIIDDDAVSVHVRVVSTGHTESSGTAHKFEILLVDADNPDPASPRSTQQAINFQYVISNITTSAADHTGPLGTVFGSFVLNSSTPIAVPNIFGVNNGTAEFAEVFRLRLTSVTNATTYFPQADATIADDDTVNVEGYIFQDLNGNGYWDDNEQPFEDVEVSITDSSGGPALTDWTDIGGLTPGRYSIPVLLGELTFRVSELITIDGWVLTTDNDSQSVEFDGSVGLTPLTPVGYDFTTPFEFPGGADTVGRGGTDDTIFGGPGDDLIDGGWGDDHIVGGHWQVATDVNAPINDGDIGLAVYDAVIIAYYIANVDPAPLMPGEIQDPQTAPIWGVDASVGAGTASVSGQIWVDAAPGNHFQNGAEGLYTGEVLVTLFDCEGNIVDLLATTTGNYTFTGLYDGGEYYVQFSLPAGYLFVAPNTGVEANDSDAEIAGATAPGLPYGIGENRINVDAGIILSGTDPVASSSTVDFVQGEFHVVESAGSITITLVRPNASTAEAIVWFASNGSALAGTNYTGSQGVVIFGIGETLATFEIPILDTNSLLACDVLDFHLNVRRPTGQPIRGGEADVYLHGDFGIPLTDDDTIFAGEDWDTVLGDSGVIGSYAVQAPFSHALITDNAGLGHDIIYGNNGPDYINAQLGNDVIYGGEGEDIIYAGYGDDRTVVELDDDVIEGGHGTDTVAGVSNRVHITLLGNNGSDPQYLRFGKFAYDPGDIDDADSVFDLFSVEKAEIFGTPGNDFIVVSNWAGELFVFGDDGTDNVSFTADVATITAADASAAQHDLYFDLYGFDVEATVTLSTGAAYHFGQMESVALTGGALANTIDASGVSFPIIFNGLGGNDILIGGSAGDTFLFDLDLANGTDTVTGNGGIDTISFAGSTAGATLLDLAIIGSNHTVRAGFLILHLTAEDIEAATGGDGADNLLGNSLSNILIGGLGNDTLTGRAGSETYRYDTDDMDWGADTIVESSLDAGHDIIDFSLTTGQTITLNMQLAGLQMVNVNLDLTITGTGVEEVIGGSMGDNIQGNSSNNTLRGGPGDDTLFGAQGDDFLDGGAGTDTLDGGDDNDSIAAVANSNFTLTNLKLLRNGADVDWLFSIDNATLIGGAGNNVFTLTGWTGDAILLGLGGNDTVVFTGDEDMVLATAGFSDVLSLGSGATFTTYSMERWTLTGGISGNALNASLYTRAGGSLVLNGNAGNDTIIGSLNDDIINGGSGNDILSSGIGNDTINGGTGNDTVVETTDSIVYTTNTGLTINRTLTGVETDDHNSIEALSVSGGAGNEFFVYDGLLAGVTAINFVGGAGTDAIYVFNGGHATFTNTALTIMGGPAITISGMEIAAFLGTADSDYADATTFSGRAFFNGGDGDDILIGSSGDDTLIGGIGNDRLTGLAGNDSLYGGDTSGPGLGAGDDTYVFDTDTALGTDTIYESTDLLANSGSDTLDFSASANATAVNLTLISNPVNVNLTINWALGTRLENLLGGSAVDTFTGDTYANRLTGNSGNDLLNGGLGDDTYLFDVDTNQGADTLTDAGGVDTLDFSATSSAKNLTINLTLAAAQQTDGVTFFCSFTNGISMENVIGGEGNDIISGNGSDNTLTGNGGNDTISGAAGKDTISGGAGNDTLQGGNNDDTFVFNAGIANQGLDTVSDSGGTDTLDFSATSGLGITFNLGTTVIQTVALSAPTNLRVQLTAVAAFENVIGGSGNDTLTGNAAVNTFTGNAGNDTIHGSAAGNDRISETRDANFVIYDFSATSARLVINGTETDTLNHIHYATLTGGDGDNILDASEFGERAAATAFLNGMAGDDTLYGGGFDYFDLANLGANAGNPAFISTMILNGGTGDDTFVFDMSLMSNNTITEEAGLPGDPPNDLHDTIIGAGGGLVNLALAGLQIPDAAYPLFSLNITSISTVEHTL